MIPPLVYCGTCEAPIRWYPTGHGRRMSVDAEPYPEGNIAIVAGYACVLSPKNVEQHSHAQNGPLYRSHFVTCPQAAAHRKRETSPEQLNLGDQ